MSTIKLSDNDDLYSATVDVGVMDVEIKEAYLGVGFLSEAGEKLSVCMRDSGFEVWYTVDGPEGPRRCTVELKEGVVRSGTFKSFEEVNNEHDGSAPSDQ